MNTIKTIIVDDEEKALKSLANKLNLFFPHMELTYLEQNPQKAIEIINIYPPDILFLDVEMPVLTGFDVLTKLNNLNFEIIFVTAYSEYAIEAFQYCAIGYVLKPIDNNDLKLAVNNAQKNIQNKTSILKNESLLNLLNNEKNYSKKINIPTSTGFSFVKLSTILHLEGYDGYTKIHLNNGTTIISSYNLGKFEKMLNQHFFKCHKSHIINLQEIESFENEGYIFLSNNTQIPISRTKKKDFFARIKY